MFVLRLYSMLSCTRAAIRTTRASSSFSKAVRITRRFMTDTTAATSASDCAHANQVLRKHGLQSLSPDCPVHHILEGLGNFNEQALQGQSVFVKPTSLFYDSAGKQRRWDAVQAHNSVAVVLYQAELQAFIVVRQFRPAVYAVRWRAAKATGLPPPSPAEGLTYELCAGIVDKEGKSVEQIACEEILEEVGYQVETGQLISCAESVISSAGVTGACQTMFFAQVNESMRVCPGGGTMAAKEKVEALSIPLSAVDGFITDNYVAKTPGLCFGLLWGMQWLQRQKVSQVKV